MPDIRFNDGKPWSVMDLVDLRHQVCSGASLDETAWFLRRSGTPSEVEARVRELGLRFQRRDRRNPGVAA